MYNIVLSLNPSGPQAKSPKHQKKQTAAGHTF